MPKNDYPDVSNKAVLNLRWGVGNVSLPTVCSYTQPPLAYLRHCARIWRIFSKSYWHSLHWIFFSLTHCNVLLFSFCKELLPPLGFTNYFQALFCLFFPWNSSDFSRCGKCVLGEPERRFSWKIMAKPCMALTWNINPLNTPLFVSMLVCGENDPAML